MFWIVGWVGAKMNCRKFERHTADFVAGRLPHLLESQMAEHAAVCERCAREVARERTLRAALGYARRNVTQTDLWPRIAARMFDEAARPIARRSLARQLAIWGALPAAACLTVWMFVRPAPPLAPQVASSVDESRVVTLVADMQEMPDPTYDPLAEQSAADLQQTDAPVSEER